jgi:glycosyltransferase involved in cell wall biosynthesis
VLSRCDGVTVVSNAIREEVVKLGCAGLPMEVVPMGVDMERFQPKHHDDGLRRDIAPNGPLLLFVGRLSEKKGLGYLLAAMPQVIERFPGATLLVVGDGEDREALEREAQGLGLPKGRIVFYGGVSNLLLPRFYATADIFIGPSVTAKGGDAEGFGLVFVEALACSCPVVATDLPAIADIVVPGENGLVVKQRSSSAIAEALLGLLEDRSLLERMKAQARKSVVDRYDWTVIGGRYAGLLGKEPLAKGRPATDA